MKYSTLLFTVFICINIQAQEIIKLSLDNPEPRVGDQVTLSFSFDFFIDELKEQLDSDIEMTNLAPHFGIANNNFQRTIKFKKAGEHTIGPFFFNFNDKQFQTDSISINVAEKLPFEEGVWVRIVKNDDGGKFLIIEQMISNKPDIKKKKDELTFTYGGGTKKNFASLVENPKEGVRFFAKQSSSTTKMDEGADLFSAGMTYSFQKYEITIDDFEEVFYLTDKHIINLPKKTSIGTIEISN